MQIDIQARDFPLTVALRSHAEQRLHFALACLDDHIQRVALQLSVINGPRGGKDKRCYMQVMLAGLSDIVIEDIEADLYVAIDRAVDRAGRTVVRKLDRQQTLLKQGRPLISGEQQLF
ncbi:MAG: HPF/RaiA family ribosome-associated protein [Gammaproteobacteria bacterium]|jgi:ribosome-associated translation inhibitor RaiA